MIRRVSTHSGCPRALLYTLVLLVMVGPGCSDSPGGQQDGGTSDGPGAADGTAPGSDAQGDTMPAKKVHEVLFSVRKLSETARILGKVKTDGTGATFPVQGMPAPATSRRLSLSPGSGLENLQVRADRPFWPEWTSTDPRAGMIILPGGRLLGVDSNRVPVLVDDLKVTALGADGFPGSGNTTVAVSPDGKLAAGAFGTPPKLRLLRLDGTQWANGTAVLELAGTDNAVGGSVIFVGNTVYCTASTSIYNGKLLQVAINGNNAGPAKEVTLPAGATIADPDLATNGKDLVGWARGGSANFIVYLVKGGGTEAKKAADKGGDTSLHSPGTGSYEHFNAMAGPVLAVSPGAKNVAFMNTTHRQFWVAKADGSERVTLNGGNNFIGGLRFGALFFAGDDNLLLWADGDLYRYQVSKKALANLTQSGTTTQAPWGKGNITPGSGWLSPSGKHLFVTGRDGRTGKTLGLFALDVATLAKTTVTEESSVRPVGVNGSSRAWFNIGGTNGQVQVFDQDNPAAATLVATVANLSGRPIPSPSGDWAAVTSDYVSNYGMRTLTAVHISGKTQLIQQWKQGASGTPMIASIFGWTPSGSGVLFVGFTSESGTGKRTYAIYHSSVFTTMATKIWDLPADHSDIRILDAK